MKVLIDTNVALNVITKRPDPYSAESLQILSLCADGTLDGYLAFHSLSTIWYVTRRFPEYQRREWLKQLCEILSVASADQTAILHAIDNELFHDFEDNLQDCCAEGVQADYIVTANVKDYEKVSIVPAVTPAQLLELFK